MLDYVQAGWWIPGKLQRGWASNLQANYNDMSAKLRQLGLVALVPGQPPHQDLGLYYSQADYDFLQLLAAPDPARGHQNPQRIVAYSCWLGAQGWAGVSPVPVLLPADTPAAAGVQIPRHAALGAFSVAGWYLLGRLDAPWFTDVPGHLARAADRRAELGLRDASPLYFTQTAACQTLQLVQSRWTGAGTQDFGAVQQYADWWGGQGFGGQHAIPFMTPTLLGDALLVASQAP